MPPFGMVHGWTPHRNAALEIAWVAVGCARNIKTAIKTIFALVSEKPWYTASPMSDKKTAKVSPLPVAWSLVKKSGKRSNPKVAVVKKKKPANIKNMHIMSLTTMIRFLSSQDI